MNSRSLDAASAARYADIALANVVREYPGKPDHVLGSDADLVPPRLLHPASDPHIVHLDGLNLSRAWCFRGIASALPDGDPRASTVHAAAAIHVAAGLRGLDSADNEGAHWLATFAALAQGG